MAARLHCATSPFLRLGPISPAFPQIAQQAKPTCHDRTSGKSRQNHSRQHRGRTGCARLVAAGRRRDDQDRQLPAPGRLLPRPASPPVSGHADALRTARAAGLRHIGGRTGAARAVGRSGRPRLSLGVDQQHAVGHLCGPLCAHCGAHGGVASVDFGRRHHRRTGVRREPGTGDGGRQGRADHLRRD